MALSATACAAFVRSMRGGFALAPSSLARAALAVVCGALPLALLPAARRAARRLSSARARDVVALHECESASWANAYDDLVRAAALSSAAVHVGRHAPMPTTTATAAPSGPKRAHGSVHFAALDDDMQPDGIYPLVSANP
ncbi:hypothetical protein KFE25_001775 [Diacronema lutheri]|uniref:Uncharacterized protein n=1 Tax=Diacronema lutheri TaxID=2081491 RepID=A0A8J5XFP0_DIALT|nr:hypothetical protein KFE25_001775 [Diacronema lutheri]